MTDIAGNLLPLTKNIGDMALKRRVTRIITELDIKKTDKVLDCGCGDGLYVKTIKELGSYSIVGFDLNGKSLKLAKNFTNGYKPSYIQGSICNLPFADNSFDKIFSTEVLEHVPDDQRALKEIYRILKPGGKLILTVPNHNYPLLWDPVNWILEGLSGKYIKSGFWAGIWNMHLRLYYPDEIESITKNAGFTINSVEPLTHYCVPFNHIVLYGLKKILDSGVLPEAMQNTANKFCVKESKQSLVIQLGYFLLALIDRPNDNLPQNKSSAAIFVKAEKAVLVPS